MAPVIGVDFDNTLVSYDELIERLACQRGLIGTDAGRGKKSVRDRIRQLPDGDIEWQRLQGIVYGPRMDEAQLIPGVTQFFRECRRREACCAIVSHKTEYAGYDDTRTNLRQAALGWMEHHRFFAPDGLGLQQHDVHFAGTRAEKIATIRKLGCTVFVDDLEETYLEPSFPAEVEKILFAPHGGHAAGPGVKPCRTWREIAEHVFHAPR